MATPKPKKRVVAVPSVEPSLNTEFLSASDEKKLHVNYDVNLNTDINAASDAKRLHVNYDADLDTNINVASDAKRLGITPPDANINTDINVASDGKRLAVNPPYTDINTDITIAPDKKLVKSVVPSASDSASRGDFLSLPQPELRNKLIMSGATPDPQVSLPNVDIKNKLILSSALPVPQAELANVDIKNKLNLASITPQPQVGDISASDDDPIKRVQYTFGGKWVSKDDPLVIGPENYSEVVNYRYTNNGLEGVGGFKHVNFEPTGTKLVNGIQLNTNYTQDSIVLIQTDEISTLVDEPVAKRLITHRTTGANIPTLGTSSSEQNFSVASSNTFVAIKLSGPQSVLCFSRDTSPENWQYIRDGFPEGYYTPTDTAYWVAVAINQNSALTIGGNYVYEVEYNNSTKKFTISNYRLGSPSSYIDFKIDVSESNLFDNIGFTIDATSSSGSLTSNTAITTDTALYEEDSNATRARFALWPNGNVAICDGVKNLVWNGDEQPVAAFLVSEASAYINGLPVSDMTEVVRKDDTDSVVSVLAGASEEYIIGSTRPLNGIYFNFGTVNTHASPTMTLAQHTLGSNTFTSISKTDGTAGFTISDKWVTWTLSASETPFYIGKYCLYFYKVSINNVSGDPTINYIRTRSDIQPVQDIWDGVLQDPIYCAFARSADFETVTETFDLTEEMGLRSPAKTTASTTGTYVMNTRALASASGGLQSFIEVMFAEPVSAIEFVIWDTNNGATLITAVGVQTNDGKDYYDTYIVYDAAHTFGDTKYMNKSGAITFEPNLSHTERRVTRNGVTGYIYKIKLTSSQQYNYCMIDLIRGVTRGQAIPQTYLFPFSYRNRAMLCNCQSDQEYNRVDYSNVNAPDSFSGPDASGRDYSNSLYFGGNEGLTGAASIFTQYGDTLQEIGIFFKNRESYVLTGNTAEDFQTYKLSSTIGCPAPLTITSADVGLQTPDGKIQSIALWLSDKGPAIFTGASIALIPGAEEYFDQFSSNYITSDFADARGWYDSTYKEYNLVFPGDELWLTYDIMRNKWFKRSVTNEFPNGAIPVINDDGETYIYTYNDDGYMSLLENTLYWGSTSYKIENYVTTSDILPFEDIWIESILRRFKVIFKDDDNGNISIEYYKDGNTANSITTTAGNDTVTFANANPDTITISSGAGNLITAGARPGMKVNIDGSTNNDSTFVIASVSALTLTLDTAETLTAETCTTAVTLTFAIEYESAMAESDSYRLRHLLCNTNLLGWVHRLKITTKSCTTYKPVLLGWGAEFVKARDEKIDKSEKN